MLERIPAHVAFAAELAIAPAQELEIVLGRMLAVPVDEVIALDSRFLHRRPDLHRPEELPEVLVGPVEPAGDDSLGVVFEIVKDRDVRIAGQLSPFRADLLVVPQVFTVHFGVGQMIERTQQYSAPGVKRHSSSDVRVPDYEFSHGADFRLRRRKGTGAELLKFLAPVAREIPIKINSLFRLLYL